MSDRLPEKPASPQQRPSHTGRLILFAFLLVMSILAAWGIVTRIEAAHALKEKTNDAAIPDVSVAEAKPAAGDEDIVLPGTVQAWHEAPIYARTSGYLKSWATDIGSPVKEGDLLAEIDTPEIDAQLHQAQADLATAEANNRLAQETAKRWTGLLKTNAVSRQEADEKIGAAEANAATVASTRANLDRLQQMESFKRVTAPFDGIITARNTDIGALINAGSGTTGQELFRIAGTDKLRIYVQVPETYAGFITPDMKAELHFAEHPGKIYPAALEHTAQALDPTARTLLIQLMVDNKDGELLPGGFAEVHLKLSGSTCYVRVPVSAILFRSDGLHIATLDKDSHAVLKPVTIGRDFGNQLEISKGIEKGETFITNPPDSLADGQPVRVVTPNDNKNKDGKDNKAR